MAERRLSLDAQAATPLVSARVGQPAVAAAHAAPLAVPFLDLKKVNDRHSASISAAIAVTLASGRYLNGEQVAKFEQEFARWTGAAHCVTVANGLDALRLCLRAWISLGRLQPGDEVIVPANTFIATALAVTDSGLTLRLADVDPATRNVTCETIEAAITPATRVVMPVHLYGQLADIERIAKLCRSRGLLMLEDAAQAHGARARGRHAGTFGDAGTFSFYPAKNLGALGDAGAVVTEDPALADRVRTLANYGAPRRYHHDFAGTNSRMDELQAAVLRIKLQGLDADNARRRATALRYLSEIRNPQVRLPQPPPEAAQHVWHVFAVTVPEREAFMNHLAAHAIETLIHYPRVIHRQAAYRHAHLDARAPNAERLQDTIVSLPMSPVLDAEQINHVIACVNAWRASE